MLLTARRLSYMVVLLSTWVPILPPGEESSLELTMLVLVLRWTAMRFAADRKPKAERRTMHQVQQRTTAQSSQREPFC